MSSTKMQRPILPDCSKYFLSSRAPPPINTTQPAFKSSPRSLSVPRMSFTKVLVISSTIRTTSSTKSVFSPRMIRSMSVSSIRMSCSELTREEISLYRRMTPFSFPPPSSRAAPAPFCKHPAVRPPRKAPRARMPRHAHKNRQGSCSP